MSKYFLPHTTTERKLFYKTISHIIAVLGPLLSKLLEHIFTVSVCQGVSLMTLTASALFSLLSFTELNLELWEQKLL